jgi:adenine deaminase
VRDLAEHQIPLTVCPLSNVKLRVFDSMANYNLKQLLDARLCVTIDSDAPAYFGGYVAENFQEIQTALKLSQEEIYQFARNSFQASFLTQEEKQLFRNELDAFITR